MNITLGMATGGTVRSETLVSLIGALDVVKSKGIGVHLNVQVGGYVARNRNEIVKQAQMNGSTHIMFVDNDMEFQPSTILRLIDSDKDIIGVHYNARGVPGKPIISTVKLRNPDNDPNKGQILTEGIPAQLFRCWALGTGLMLIRMSVFERLAKPYFTAWESEDGEHHTEDVDFCHKAGIAGFEVWCNPTIPVKHIGTYEY